MTDQQKRGSGILLHLTSLPSRYGIGDLGRTAVEFINFLAESGQQYWQFLPIGPTSPAFDNSPYMSLSAFAGNPLLIDPDTLVKEGWLTPDDLADHPPFSDFLVEFNRVIPFKAELLGRAFARFKDDRALDTGQKFGAFCEQTPWLDDYALYMSLREENNLLPWHRWPANLARHEKTAIRKARKILAERIDYYRFEQFCFFSQWQRLHAYARQKKIALIGDIPFYIGQDSADAWGHQDLFRLDPETLKPTHVAGVPPDYFSDTGQRWGNPIYRWQTAAGKVNPKIKEWWRQRFCHIFATMDIVRIDHFRGFEAYWEVKAEEEYAINGEWIKGPGLNFFRNLEQDLGKMPIIAEDLGLITPEVEELRKALGYPGMKVLQFAFDSDEKNTYLPHNYPSPNCVVYTGTHDNDTTIGWYLSAKASEVARRNLKKQANSRDESEIHWDVIRLAFSSTANLAMAPLQDILGYGGDCRMNTPSTCQGNWQWRAAPKVLTPEIRDRLAGETRFYNRAPEGGRNSDE